MAINYTDLPDGHHVGIINSQSWVILPWKCQPGSRFVSAALWRHLFLLSFKRLASLATGVLASLVWWLCCPSPFCHGNYADDIGFLGWVWYVVFTHTQLLKEMSAGLYRRRWQTPWRAPPNRGREINEFLKDALSTTFSPTVSPSSPKILWTCLSSYHLLHSLFFCSVPSPCSWPFTLSPYLLMLLISLPSSPAFSPPFPSLPNTSLIALIQFWIPILLQYGCNEYALHTHFILIRNEWDKDDYHIWFDICRSNH